jgi:hypothetical protein
MAALTSIVGFIFSLIFLSCHAQPGDTLNLPAVEVLNWKSKHLDISVEYAHPWAKADFEIGQ